MLVLVLVRAGRLEIDCSPADIREIKHSQADIVLMVRDLEIFLQANDFGISNVCPVEE